LVNIAPTGELLNEAKLGGSENDFLYSAFETSEGEIILSGQTYSSDLNEVEYIGNGDGWIVSTNQKGDMLWQELVGGEEIDDIKKAILSNSGSILTAGSSMSRTGQVNSNSGGWDFWMTEINGKQLIIEENDWLIFPNPTTSNINYMLDNSTSGEIRILDMSGRLIYSENIFEVSKGQVSVEDLPKGIYTIQCINDTKLISTVFVKQ
jgi:hypothetical protein